MNKTLIAVGGFFGLGILAIITVAIMWVSYSNSEVRLRNTIVAKQRDNQNEMDAMWKNISQTAQVAEKDRSSLMEIMTGYAQARTGTGDASKSIMNWIKESVPQVSSKVFSKLLNIIVSQRDGFKFRQKELLDLKREHDNLIDTFPSSLFVGSRGKIDVVIVTSTRTDNAFKSGKDDETQLFGTPNAEKK
jgi:hypothetical protein